MLTIDETDINPDILISLYCSKIAALYSNFSKKYVETYMGFPEGLSTIDAQILLSVLKLRAASPSQIANTLSIDRSSITRRIKVLERLNLVSIEKDRLDLRSKSISLLPKGKTIACNYETAFASLINEQDIEEFSESELTMPSIINFLQIVSDIADTRLNRPKPINRRHRALGVGQNQLANDRGRQR